MGLSPELIGRLADPLAPLGGVGWIVGGALRDAVLGRPVLDVDVAVPGAADVAARALARDARAGRFALSADFGGWRVHGGSLPFTVDVVPLQGGSIQEDLARRDLTVNAMAAPLAGGALIDPHGGRADIARRLLRVVAPDAFRADPLRTLRLLRQARELDFAIEPETLRLAGGAAPGLADVSPERARAEIVLMMGGPDPGGAAADLISSGVVDGLLPELGQTRGLLQGGRHHVDVAEHTALVVVEVARILADPGSVFGEEAGWIAERLDAPLGDGLTRGRGVALAALLHDVGKPVVDRTADAFPGHARRGAEIVREWSVRMRFATRLAEFLEAVVARHSEVGALAIGGPGSSREAYRALLAWSPVEVELLVLAVADRAATRGGPDPDLPKRQAVALARRLAADHRSFAAATRTPILDGTEIARIVDRPPGPWLGRAVAALREEQAVGAVTDEQGAIDFVRTLQ